MALNTTPFQKRLQDIDGHIYTPEEIKNFRMDEAINEHPLKRKPINLRSRLAYQEILRNLKPTSKYLLPGQIVCFEYLEPKTEADLEYWDKTPLTVFCGLTRDNKNNIREIGVNLHYFPPFARTRVLNSVYEVFKRYYQMQFNESQHKVNAYISYRVLKSLMKKYKIGFATKMYVPSLRSRSYVVPTRLLPTALYTEGHFSKASLQQIMQFWRQFK